MRTRYSSPTAISPSLPRVFLKVANSDGDARSGSAATHSSSSVGETEPSRITAT